MGEDATLGITAAVKADIKTLFTTTQERQIINANRYKIDEITRSPVFDDTETEFIAPVIREEVKISFVITGITVSKSGPHFIWINNQLYEDGEHLEDDSKIKVLHESIAGMHAWASAIRRDQSPDRAKAPIVGWDKKFDLVKVSPLANWTKAQVWKMITDHDIPYNPLHDQGYTSVGCWPCTRTVMFGDDERAGRWCGFAKTECGLHSLD